MPHHCDVVRLPLPGVYSTRLASGWHFARHWHDSYGFGLLRRGAQVSASGRGTVEAFEGDVITSHPGEVHDGRPLGTELRCWQMVHLEPSALGQIIDDHSATLHLTEPVFRDAAVAQALDTLFQLIAQWNGRADRAPGSDLQLAIESVLVHCCHAIVRRGERAPLERTATAAIKRVRERLADASQAVPSLAELAAETGLSRYQVLRQFERNYGLPPYAWLLVRRAESARRLISERVSLSDAAAAAGFADQSHMTRVFKRHFGFTPGEWQAVIRR